MNVIELLDDTARRWPDRWAFIEGRRGRERQRTFAAFRDRSCRIASRFAQAGLGPGDGIVLLIPVSAALYETLAGALRLGLTASFIDPAWSREQLEDVLSQCSVRAFAGTPRACLFRLLSPPLRRIAKVFVSGRTFPGAVALRSTVSAEPWRHCHDADPDAAAILAFTSGSTGAPKAVVRTHRLLLDTHRVLSEQLELAPGGIDMATMPGMVLANLGTGVTTLLPDMDMQHPGAAAPAPLLDQIQRWQPTSTVASPALMERLAVHCQRSGQRLETFQRIVMGGAPVFPRTVDKVRGAAPQARVIGLYGSTEAEPMALLPFEQMTAQDRQAVRAGGGLPAGRPVPGIDLRILEDTYGNPRPDCSVGEFDAMTLAADAVGEIVVSGPQVAKGYLGGRGDSANKFRVDGTVWHRTGDAGRLDAQGRLWLLGRCTARIHTPLGAHYPLATEAALSERPEVERSALLHRGQRTVLVVQMAQGGQPADVDEICRAVPWVAIDDVAVVGRLPLDRRHNAKVDYPALHALLDAGRGVTWHRPGFTRGR